MELFKWGKRFETNIDRVDSQHRGLIDLVNTTAARIGDPESGPVDLDLVLSDLKRYARTHFAEEEELMERGGLDERHVSVHKHEHAGFMRDVHAFEIGLRSGEGVDLEQMLRYLSHWLAYHILGVDQSMARQLRAVENGVAADEAFLREHEREAGALDPMLEAVQGLLDVVRRRNEELRDLNRSLESKVRERTTRLEQLSEELRILAMRDELTRLENRRSALLWLDSIWEREEAMSVIMFDLDEFKAVNDTHGHEAGDRVLQHVARVLRGAFRGDDIVSRLGGDEFLVICPDTDAAAARELAERALTALRAERVVDNKVSLWQGQASIGVATRQPEFADPNALLRAVDSAVYDAKRSGRDRVRIWSGTAASAQA